MSNANSPYLGKQGVNPNPFGGIQGVIPNLPVCQWIPLGNEVGWSEQKSVIIVASRVQA